MTAQTGPRPDRVDGARAETGRGAAARPQRPGAALRSATDPADLTVHVRRCGPRPLVTVSGALDLWGAPLLAAMLDHVERTEGQAPDVDLGQVDYADSHGLGPLLVRRTPVRRASPLVSRLLEALGTPLPHGSSDGFPSRAARPTDRSAPIDDRLSG